MKIANMKNALSTNSPIAMAARFLNAEYDSTFLLNTTVSLAFVRLPNR